MYSGNGFLAVAAREAAAKAKAEAQIEADKAATKAADKAKRDLLRVKTLAVMQGWHRGVALNVIAAMVGLPENKVTKLISVFEKVKTHCATKEAVNEAELKQLSGLDEAELKVLLALLERH
jgi:NADH:ubiquinone oxidoreductase subunit E